MRISAQALGAEAKSNMYIYICADANMCTGIMCRGKKNMYIHVQMQICAQALCAEAKNDMYIRIILLII